MSRSIVRRLRGLAAAGVAGVSLTGCASDPAFWEGMALAADAIAATTASCYYRYNAYGVSEYYCPPSYGYAPVYVTPVPVYTPPRSHNYNRHDRRDRRDWRRDRDHDRGGHHGGRRGGKGRHG